MKTIVFEKVGLKTPIVKFDYLYSFITGPNFKFTHKFIYGYIKI